jgi:PiT family inorganic phosphate transporter
MTGTGAALLAFIIIFCLAFALTNGLHDASSVVATFISCGAATPRQAIVLSSVFGLLGAVFGGSAVANTVSGVIDLPVQPQLLGILLAAVLGATAWNLLTWKLGLPSSSTHALVGGIVGAVLVSSGPGHVLWGVRELFGASHELTGIVKVVVFLLLSPAMGFALAFLLEKLSKLLLRNAKFSVNRVLKGLQWLISALLSYSHGVNDTQKITGLITLALSAAGGEALKTVPLWVQLVGGTVMSAGTLLGGWSIMKTIGSRIYKLRPIHSLNSQLSAAASVLTANLFGAPVSTTHVVVGSVMGVGAADRYKDVNWGVTREIAVSWVVTIPLAAGVSAAVYWVFSLIFNLG